LKITTIPKNQKTFTCAKIVVISTYSIQSGKLSVKISLLLSKVHEINNLCIENISKMFAQSKQKITFAAFFE